MRLWSVTTINIKLDADQPQPGGLGAQDLRVDLDGGAGVCLLAVEAVDADGRPDRRMRHAVDEQTSDAVRVNV